MHIFDIAEIVVIIFPYLNSVDRAKSRLVSPVFNSIYLTEETTELIEKWQSYSRELCYENINSPLSDDELQDLMKEFDYPDMQFHLKVWLTKCTRGYTCHEYDLVSVATTDHWETAHSILEQFYCYMPLDNEFGENEWQDRLIIVMNRVPFTVLDKKSGHFYVITDTEYPMVEDKGTIKDWMDSIPIERVGELSFNHVRYDYECNKYVKVMKEGSKKKLVAFLKRYSRYYRFLDEDLRRDPDILEVIKKGWSHDIASSFIPPEIRLDWDKYLDFFRLYKWHSNMHYKFKRDKEYVLKLLKLDTIQIDHFSIDPKMINDPDISELMVEDSFLEMSDFRAKTKEQWRKLYYKGPISIFSFDREVTKDFSFMVNLIAEQTGYYHEGNEYLEDEEAIFKIRNKLILSLVSPKLLNDKQFMLKWYNIDPQASYFIGDSLKTDTEIMTNTNALKYQTGLNLTKPQIVEILNSLNTNSNVCYLMRKCFVKNFIPKDYLQDEEFLLDLIRICPSTSVLINRNLRTNLPFWARVVEINPEVLELGLVPPKLKLEMIKYGLITEEEPMNKHQEQEFKHDEKYYEDDDSFDEDEEKESDEDEDDEIYWNRPPMKFVRLPSKLSNI